jgi:hypothetical protein
MKRMLSLLAVASWVAMVVLLIRKQAAAPLRDASWLPVAAVDERDEWFGVYHDGEKVGHAHRVAAGTTDGYALYEDCVVALAMLGTPQTLRTSLAAETDASFALRRFRFTLISPAAVFSATGTTDGEHLSVTYGAEGERERLSIPVTGPIYLPSTLRPRVLAGDLASGTRYAVPVFNPLTLRNEPMTVTVEGRETLAGSDGPVEAIRLAEEHQGVRVRAWLASDGAVLREESVLGFTLERESSERALTKAGAGTPVDLTAVSRIPFSGRIDDPRGAARLVLRLRAAPAGGIPDDPPRQRVTADVVEITREALPTAAPLSIAPQALASLRAYTIAAPFIESDDPAVVAEARAIVGAATDATSAARRLVAWVAAHVETTPSVTVPSARAVLVTRRGDCNEHAVLLTALARAAGIPARVVAGAVYALDGFYYHAWTELWLGRWVSADSVFAQMPADATHIKLVEGGPEQHVALAALVGRLDLALEEVR